MLSPGVALGHRYELEERVGVGGYSEVWRAHDRNLGRLVAVKVLHPGYLQDAAALARFQTEARYAGRLAHENIARVYDYGEPHPPYLVMELVEGPSLAELMADGPMDPARVMDLLAQAADGLQAAHAAGLIHRDIKPGNLLLTPDGVVKITDFGISRAVNTAGVTITGQILGTPGYLAPERAAGAGATALSDLYSLGVVAYECLAGAPPFDGTALEVALAHATRPLPALPPFVPPDVGELVAFLTAKNPADRPASAAEVAHRARQLGVGLAPDPTVPRPAFPAAAVRPPGRPRRSAVIGVSAIAVILFIGLVSLVGFNLATYHDDGHRAAAPASSAASPGPSHRPSATPATVSMVDVNSQSLVGQPADAVASTLRQHGLVPRIVWQPSDQQQPGMVTDVWPTGQQRAGTLVTVVAALSDSATAAASSPASAPVGNSNGGSGSGSGNNGNGNGKHKGSGNGNGHGNG